jgi:hypothetical protein
MYFGVLIFLLVILIITFLQKRILNKSEVVQRFFWKRVIIMSVLISGMILLIIKNVFLNYLFNNMNFDIVIFVGMSIFTIVVLRGTNKWSTISMLRLILMILSGIILMVLTLLNMHMYIIVVVGLILGLVVLILIYIEFIHYKKQQN